MLFYWNWSVGYKIGIENVTFTGETVWADDFS